jgi:hypothetical protein
MPKGDGDKVAGVPQGRSERGLERAISIYDGEECEGDVAGRKDGDGHEDKVRDFMIECEKEFDEAGKEKEDCRVQQEGDVFDHPAHVETMNACVEISTTSDANYRVLRKLGESQVPAEPLLHQRGKQAAPETEAETEEPKHVHMDQSTSDPERFEVRSGKSISNGEPGEFLGDLLKKPGGHLGGIRLEVLVAVDEKCSDCRGEYTCLDSVVPKGKCSSKRG